MKKTYRVGQRLWLYHPFLSARCRYVEITRVGRKWLYVGEGVNTLRIDKTTLDVYGENKYRCYESREIWLELKFKMDAWDRLKTDIWGAIPPPGLTLEDIQSFHKKLRGEDA